MFGPAASRQRVFALASATLWCGPASGDSTLPDTFLARVGVLASMQTLNADILARRSGTKVLENWCADHGLARPAKIRAVAVQGAAKEIGAAQRQRLVVAIAGRLGDAPGPTRAGRRFAIPDILFEHQAVLYDRSHRPFSEVEEHDTREILAFSGK